jgi:hypothetical protein
MPLGARLSGSLAVSRLFPKLMPTRNLPPGARSERTAGEMSLMIAHAAGSADRAKRVYDRGVDISFVIP